MKRSHWKFKKKPDIHNMFGFVYVITNLQTTKKYIGCKQYWHYSKRKKTKESNWKSYTGSSALLNEDIKKLGKRNFTFNIIAEFKNKRSLKYYELYYQMKYNVLSSTIEGSDEPAFYNKYVGGKFYRPVQQYDEE
tara:strand:+ start:6596 stop:7000 length:405 start_codon:yes stop_codon:yes gene_type:complete